MYHLIVAILSIALMGFATVAQIQYVNPQAMLASGWQKTLLNDLENFEQGFSLYRQANTSVVTTVTESEGVITETTDVNFQRPTSINDLRGYVTPPSTAEGVDWTIGTAADGVYVCLQGSFPAPLAMAVNNLKRTHYSDGAFGAKLHYNSDCGAAITSSGVSMQNMAVTYWLLAP
ncbi:MAG: hypothetical protein Q8S08_02265 [Halomonas sp.]|nr:hypothetical protein [Halomonas sp.]MDP3534193.1 hypothetical protein [Halomonas sp.]